MTIKEKVTVYFTTLSIFVILGESFPVDTGRNIQCAEEVSAAGRDVNCSFRSLTEIPQNLPNPTYIRVLNLKGNKINQIPVGSLDAFKELFILKLMKNQITKLTVGVFDAVYRLGRLYMDHNKISALPVGIFDSLNQLRLLTIWDNQITSLPIGVFDSLHSLQYLWMANNLITHFPPGVFDALTDIRSWYFGSNQITKLDANIFDIFKYVAIIDFSSNKVVNLPSGLFDSTTVLQKLYFQYTMITGIPVGMFDFLTDLKSLNFNDVPLSSLDVDLFANLKALTSLVLPVMCNCTENQLYILPFVETTNIDVKIAVRGTVIINSLWMNLTKSCRSTWLSFPDCERFKQKEEEETTNWPLTLPITDTAVSSNNQLTTPSSMDLDGITYVTIAAIVGGIASAFILYLVSVWIGRGTTIVKTCDMIRTQKIRLDLMMERQVESAITDLFTTELEDDDNGSNCKNIPPCSHRGMIM